MRFPYKILRYQMPIREYAICLTQFLATIWRNHSLLSHFLKSIFLILYLKTISFNEIYFNSMTNSIVPKYNFPKIENTKSTICSTTRYLSFEWPYVLQFYPDSRNIKAHDHYVNVWFCRKCWAFFNCVVKWNPSNQSQWPIRTQWELEVIGYRC